MEQGTSVPPNSNVDRKAVQYNIQPNSRNSQPHTKQNTPQRSPVYNDGFNLDVPDVLVIPRSKQLGCTFGTRMANLCRTGYRFLDEVI